MLTQRQTDQSCHLGYMAIGMLFGMIGGMAYGGNLDKKAFKEGRQLNIEIKY